MVIVNLLIVRRIYRLQFIFGDKCENVRTQTLGGIERCSGIADVFLCDMIDMRKYHFCAGGRDIVGRNKETVFLYRRKGADRIIGTGFKGFGER